jgi:hypothetical protein
MDVPATTLRRQEYRIGLLRGAAGTGLDTTIKYMRGAVGKGLGTTIKYLRRTTSVAAGNGLGTTVEYHVSPNAGADSNWAKARYSKAEQELCLLHSSCSIAASVVNLEPTPGKNYSVRFCMGPEFARCVICT